MTFDLFEIKNGQLVISGDALSVASLRDIWDSDKTAKKSAAMDSFLFIYHMYHPKSPYSGYSDTKREAAVRKNELSNVLRTSKKLEKAIEDFVAFRDDAAPIFSLFQSCKKTLYKIGLFLDNSDPMDESFDIKKVTDAAAKLGPLIKSFKQLEDQVKDEVFTTTKTRGDRAINHFEE